MCPGVRALLYLQDFLRTPLTIPGRLEIGLPRLDCCPSFDFCFELLVNRASFLVRVRHFALLLDLKMFLTSPAVAMWRSNKYKNLTTIQDNQKYEVFRFA